MAEQQGNEFELDVEGHVADSKVRDLVFEAEEDVEGHRTIKPAADADEDVEGHRASVVAGVQPPRDTDLGGSER